MKFTSIAPVLISIAIIILIAILQRYSRVVAGITATMPVTIPLSLWIVYSASSGEKEAVETYTRSMAIGIFSTVAFTIALWLGARVGLKLGPLIAVAYGAWLAALAVSFAIRGFLGI